MNITFLNVHMKNIKTWCPQEMRREYKELREYKRCIFSQLASSNEMDDSFRRGAFKYNRLYSEAVERRLSESSQVDHWIIEISTSCS